MSRSPLRVSVTPARDHDYVRGLFEKMSSRDVAEMAAIPNTARAKDVQELTRELDIVHVGWPEHLLANPGIAEADFDREVEAFVAALGESHVRVVWTMHNRRPHWWAPERGRWLYRTWAQIADAVIHHSEWGMNLARQEYPYKADARHVVLPHGHYRDQMRVSCTRAELEKTMALPPCALRLGVMGRPQAEKRVEMILRAFMKGARADQQLLVTAYDDKTPRPDDPRIIFLPRQQWMSREDIANSTHVCDAMISAHVGDTYITSGLCADSIGTGVPMLVPHWEFFHETLGAVAFYHDNTEESLAALFHSITPAEAESKRASLIALQPGSEWSLIAEKTVALYHSLGRK